MFRIVLFCKRTLLFLFIFILTGYGVVGQELAFRHFAVSDGLASATVYSCMQDDKGYLWFGTESGVNVFNGQKFDHYSVDDGLGDSEIFGVFQDSRRRIWFLSFNGHFSYYLDGKFYNEENARFLKRAYCGQSLTGMHEDSKGRIWINSSDRFLVMIDGDQVRKFDFFNMSHLTGGVNVIIHSDGSSEFRYGDRVYKYNETSNEFEIQQKGKYIFFNTRPCHSETGENFNIIKDGIAKAEVNGIKLLTANPNLNQPNHFTSLYHEKSGWMWVGTYNSGVQLYSFQKDTMIFTQKYLTGVQINDIFKDHEGNLWMCTNDEGIYMLPSFDRHTVFYNKSEHFPANNIYSVFYDSKDKLWTGGDKGIVSCIDSSGKILKNYKLSADNNNNYRVNGIAEDSASNIWLTTNGGIYKIDKNGNQSEVVTVKNSIRGPGAGKALAIDKKGDVYLAFYAGILKYKKDVDGFELLPNQGYPIRTFYLTTFRDRIFVANINGLCHYKNDSLLPLYKFDKRLTDRISCMKSVNDSVLAITTSGHGVYIYMNDTIIQHLSTASGLPSNDCRSIFVNGNDVWIVTDKGLVKFYLHNNLLLLHDISNTISGLYSNAIRAVCVKSGKIYSATSYGLVIINENEYMLDPVGPPVLFLTFEANNKQLPFDSLTNLRYNHNNITISYEALSFNNPGQIQYEYVLVDTEKKIKQTKANEIILTWLPPGNYTLTVKAKIANGRWGPPSILKFSIKKPLWETAGFRILFVLCVIGFISFPFYLYYKRKIRHRWLQIDKQAAVNKERQRISYDLHDDLGSALTSITMNAEIIKHKKMFDVNFDKELEDLSVYARDANEKMSDIVWAVSVSNDHLPGLSSYINEFISDFESRIGIPCVKTIESHLSNISIRPEARKNIFLTVKEAFHNIQKHSRASKVFFELFISNDILNISIRDNGKGFNESEILDSSVGLSSMKKRMESIEGEIIIITKPEVGTDLMIRYNLTEKTPRKKSYLSLNGNSK